MNRRDMHLLCLNESHRTFNLILVDIGERSSFSGSLGQQVQTTAFTSTDQSMNQTKWAHAPELVWTDVKAPIVLHLFITQL